MSVSKRLRAFLGIPVRGGSASDGCLLEAYSALGDGEAFRELVRRHGRMVLSVCRRVTGHEQDAEDAFQAAFLVLARKAAAVRPPERVGNWLYGVAYRTALNARQRSWRARPHDARATEARLGMTTGHD